MAICPFCKSTVSDDATVCPKCHAEKVTTFKGHFEKAVEQIKPLLRLFGMLGLLMGFLFGTVIGLKTFLIAGFIVGVVIFILVTFFPAIIKALFKKNKVVWYR